MALRVGPLRIATLTFICIVLGSSAPAAASGKGDGHHLHVDLYKGTCPQAEDIINGAVLEAMDSDPGVAAALVRLHFHDCFVNGCDASILLDVTPSGELIEKASPSNIGVRGTEVIEEAKTRLEKECPNTISCADIVAFAARDAAVASGINYYKVPAGRRDGLVSRSINTKGNLPKPSSNLTAMVNIFAQKGLSVHDLVVLLGSHSIGASHCSSFDYRLYNFSQVQTMDPMLDELFAFTLKMICPKREEMNGEVNGDLKVHLDRITPRRLDQFFYLELLAGRSVLHSDQTLIQDPQTREIVMRMAFEPDLWNREFGKSMIRMGRTDVLTGNKGEIRRDCRFVNN